MTFRTVWHFELHKLKFLNFQKALTAEKGLFEGNIFLLELNLDLLGLSVAEILRRSLNVPFL